AVGGAAEELRQAHLLTCGSILHLVQALMGTVQAAMLPHLWLVTRNAQPVAATDPIAPAQAPLWGLGHTIAAEYPELHCRCLDLPASTDEVGETAGWLLDE